MTDTKPSNPTPETSVVLYRTEDGRSRVQVRLDAGNAWLTQAAMAELFQTTVPNISMHLRNVFRDGELHADSVVKKSLTAAADGKSYETRYYHLDAVLAVGYRVRSPRGTQFRQWATERLREFLVKGFVLDDDRLKGRDAASEHFEELLERIREIRASEARVYQRIREIFALAVDYREGDGASRTFFAAMQNKMHFAATGMTAAEIVLRRADAARPNMGLTTWAGGRVLKRDVAIAKNYLDADEIDTLNRIVVMFLDQAEFRVRRRRDIRIGDWEGFLDKFLRDNELPVLVGAGSVGQDEASAYAEIQYDEFAVRRRADAETEAEGRYLEDLTDAARLIEERAKPKPRRTVARASKKS